MSDRRYPFAPLASVMGFTEATAIRELGIGGTRAKRLRDEGLTVDLADRYATRAGFHPSEVWPSWVDDALEDRRARRRAQQAAWARNRYQTDTQHRRAKQERVRDYHATDRAGSIRSMSYRARNAPQIAERKRAWWEKAKAEQNARKRERYATDPSYRERVLAGQRGRDGRRRTAEPSHLDENVA